MVGDFQHRPGDRDIHDPGRSGGHHGQRRRAPRALRGGNFKAIGCTMSSGSSSPTREHLEGCGLPPSGRLDRGPGLGIDHIYLTVRS